MAENWLADVQKYAANADETVVAAIVRYCGIALQNKDSSLVAFSDKKETDLVRENYLKKKLGLTNSDADLDSAIASVGERMKEDRTKNRVTVYYLLAEHFGLLSVFGGVAAAAGAGLSAAAAAMSGEDDKKDTDDSSVAPLAAVGAAGAAAAAVSAPVHAAADAASTTPNTAYSGGGSYGDDDSSGGMGWLKWLLLAALLAALLFFLLKSCNGNEADITAPGSRTETSATSDTAKVDTATTGTTTSGTATTAATAVPQGAGVVAADREGKPMLSVYFDTNKSDVTNDLATAAANVKAYVEKNAGTKLAVSGFNDPTGNAAINAELSKKRAQAVKAALEKLGIPADSIELVKPSDTTDASGDNTAARRVEVTIK